MELYMTENLSKVNNDLMKLKHSKEMMTMEISIDATVDLGLLGPSIGDSLSAIVEQGQSRHSFVASFPIVVANMGFS
ncbi:hypothetical protein V6N13_108932 [Hibiscus sabdariffa]